jgi:multiple sugar transport system substrate-binding protein
VRGTLRVSPLLNKEMQTQFGADLSYLKGRNLQSIFKGKIVASPDYSPNNGKAQNIASQQFFNEYLPGKKDLNSVLSDTDMLINQMLDDNKK